MARFSAWFNLSVHVCSTLVLMCLNQWSLMKFTAFPIDKEYDGVQKLYLSFRRLLYWQRWMKHGRVSGAFVRSLFATWAGLICSWQNVSGPSALSLWLVSDWCWHESPSLLATTHQWGFCHVICRVDSGATKCEASCVSFLYGCICGTVCKYT